MFKTAREIVREYHPLAGDREDVQVNPHEMDWRKIKYREETNAELWNRKADEADVNGLSDALRTHGVTTPIPLSTTPNPPRKPAGKAEQRNMPTVLNGHHRTASMRRNAPDTLVPVEHYATTRVQFPPDRGVNGEKFDGDTPWDNRGFETQARMLGEQFGS